MFVRIFVEDLLGRFSDDELCVLARWLKREMKNRYEHARVYEPTGKPEIDLEHLQRAKILKDALEKLELV